MGVSRIDHWQARHTIPPPSAIATINVLNESLLVKAFGEAPPHLNVRQTRFQSWNYQCYTALTSILWLLYVACAPQERCRRQHFTVFSFASTGRLPIGCNELGALVRPAKNVGDKMHNEKRNALP
jgi:hypothetical protein